MFEQTPSRKLNSIDFSQKNVIPKNLNRYVNITPFSLKNGTVN